MKVILKKDVLTVFFSERLSSSVVCPKTNHSNLVEYFGVFIRSNVEKDTPMHRVAMALLRPDEALPCSFLMNLHGIVFTAFELLLLSLCNLFIFIESWFIMVNVMESLRLLSTLVLTFTENK